MTTPYTDSWFAMAASIFVMIMIVVLFISIGRVHRAWGDIDENPGRLRRETRRMLFLVGVWQISVGLLLIVLGNGVNSVALIGMGIMLMGVSWFRLLPGFRDTE